MCYQFHLPCEGWLLCDTENEEEMTTVGKEDVLCPAGCSALLDPYEISTDESLCGVFPWGRPCSITHLYIEQLDMVYSKLLRRMLLRHLGWTWFCSISCSLSFDQRGRRRRKGRGREGEGESIPIVISWSFSD